MNDHASVVRVERHEPAAGRRAEVAGVLKSVAEAARDASGRFVAQVARSDGDPDEVVLLARVLRRTSCRVALAEPGGQSWAAISPGRRSSQLSFLIDKHLFGTIIP